LIDAALSFSSRRDEQHAWINIGKHPLDQSFSFSFSPFWFRFSIARPLHR